jgi:hypothetical protein
VVLNTWSSGEGIRTIHLIAVKDLHGSNSTATFSSSVTATSHVTTGF